MKTLSKLKLHELGIEQSDFINKKAQNAILGGKVLIACRCGFYGDFLSDCYVCPYGDIYSCLNWAGEQCGGHGATCSGETGGFGLDECN